MRVGQRVRPSHKDRRAARKDFERLGPETAFLYAATPAALLDVSAVGADVAPDALGGRIRHRLAADQGRPQIARHALGSGIPHCLSGGHSVRPTWPLARKYGGWPAIPMWSRLLIFSADGTVAMSYARLPDAVDDLCRRQLRDLLPDERLRYNITEPGLTCPSLQPPASNTATAAATP